MCYFVSLCGKMWLVTLCVLEIISYTYYMNSAKMSVIGWSICRVAQVIPVFTI